MSCRVYFGIAFDIVYIGLGWIKYARGFGIPKC